MFTKIDNLKNIRILTWIAAACLFFIFAVPAVHADSEDVSGLTVSIGEVRTITLESGSFNFSPDINELLDGRTEHQSWDAIVSANVGWVLTIRGAEDTWDGPWDKPVSDILWEYDGGGYMPLDTEPQIVCSGGPSNREPYPIGITVQLDFEKDIPGDYHYGYIVLELSAP